MARCRGVRDRGDSHDRQERAAGRHGRLSTRVRSNGAQLAEIGRLVERGTPRVATPAAWLTVALVPDGGTWAVLLLAAAQAAYGFGLGLEDPNELGYRQAVTPPGLQGRMNATMRSVNRTMAVVGALAGGLLGDRIGLHPTLWIAVVVFSVAAAVIAFSPLRGARHDARTT